MVGSGCEIVTVALRRVDIDNPGDSMLSHIDRAPAAPGMPRRRSAWRAWRGRPGANRG
jgi:hypothetical protein